MHQSYNEHQLLTLAQNDPTLSVTIVDHPLVRDSLKVIRDKKTSMVGFRRCVHALTYHLIFAATKDLQESSLTISTPLAQVSTTQISDQIVLIPVLRSGIGMLEPAQNIFPTATTIFAGMARDESTAIPHWYYDLKSLACLNQGQGAVFLILDPMLATGGSAIETINRIKAIYPQGTIKMICMIAAPEGIKALTRRYPDVTITVAAVDDHLNQHKFIVPGLGDAGDRQFGTL